MPVNERQRLAALRALDILDSAQDIAYDEIAELPAQICGCPVAYISFIDDDRRWLKAKYGLPPWQVFWLHALRLFLFLMRAEVHILKGIH
jgi:hypothetical protein